jgi:hypothetical protein
VPYLLLGVLTLGTGLAIGFGLSEAPPTLPLTLQGHGTFGECSAKTTAVAASINRGTLSQGQPLTVTLGAKNVGNADCRYSGFIQRGLTLMPCNDSPTLAILNSNGQVVWPSGMCGPIPPRHVLHPGQTAHARGQWNLRGPNGTMVPSGRYTVEVALSIRFSIVVES